MVRAAGADAAEAEGTLTLGNTTLCREYGATWEQVKVDVTCFLGIPARNMRVCDIALLEV